jgi:dienelactone hydrolase
MRKETLKYKADGLDMESVLFLPDAPAANLPGVLVFPEASGLGANALSRAERLSKLGYAALGCDLYGGGLLLSDMDQIMAALGPLMQAPERIRARAGGALKALAEHSAVDANRIAATGYCFGGTMSLELARCSAPIKAVVGFHSGLQTTAPATADTPITAKILVCLGADDPGVPPEQRSAFEDEMRASKADWQMHLYGNVVHGFTNREADKMGRPDFLRYDAEADRRSWAAQLQLLEDTIAKA